MIFFTISNSSIHTGMIFRILGALGDQGSTEKKIDMRLNVYLRGKINCDILKSFQFGNSCALLLRIIRYSFNDIFIFKKDLFQECEGSLKHKTELITKLEAKTLSMTETIQKMDEKYVYLFFNNVIQLQMCLFHHINYFIPLTVIITVNLRYFLR